MSGTNDETGGFRIRRADRAGDLGWAVMAHGEVCHEQFGGDVTRSRSGAVVFWSGKSSQGTKSPTRPGHRVGAMTDRARRSTPDGYVSGPAAATEATAVALPRAEQAHTVVLVEGVSDQIAVEALLAAHDIAVDHVAVLPTGGAHGMGRYAAALATGRRLVALCDAREAPIVRRRLDPLGVPLVVCDRDLEDELIRSVGTDLVIATIEANGDARAFRTMQRQASWVDRPVHEQLRRFLGAGATRKSRYATLLAELAIAHDVVPPPLTDLLGHLDG